MDRLSFREHIKHLNHGLNPAIEITPENYDSECAWNAQEKIILQMEKEIAASKDLIIGQQIDIKKLAKINGEYSSKWGGQNMQIADMFKKNRRPRN